MQMSFIIYRYLNVLIRGIISKLTLKNAHMILLLTCTRFNEKDLNFPELGWIRILKFKQNLRPLIEKYLLSPFDFRGNSICIIDVNSGTVLMKYKHKVTYYNISRCCQTNSNRLQIFFLP